MESLKQEWDQSHLFGWPWAARGFAGLHSRNFLFVCFFLGPKSMDLSWSSSLFHVLFVFELEEVMSNFCISRWKDLNVLLLWVQFNVEVPVCCWDALLSSLLRKEDTDKHKGAKHLAFWVKNGGCIFRVLTWGTIYYSISTNVHILNKELVRHRFSPRKNNGLQLFTQN